MKQRIRLWTVLIYAFMFLFALSCLLPMINVLALSFNDALDSRRGGFLLFPRVFSLENYRRILRFQNLGSALSISVFRTVVGIALSLLFNTMYAYALSKRHLIARKFLHWYTIIPMYFGAGLIPFYLVLNGLGLTNTIWVYVLPYAVTPFHIILLRTFMRGIPESIEESAKLDGAGYFRLYVSLVIPLSTPVLATVALFAGVSQWNDWFVGTAFVFTNDLWPLQTLLKYVLSIAEFKESQNLLDATEQLMLSTAASDVTAESLKMAMIVITMTPILCIYPFMQRYFISGISVGSLKE